MRYFETTIRVPMPDGSLAWGKVAAAIEPAFEALAKGLARAGVDGVTIDQREIRIKGPRAPKIIPPEQVITSPPVLVEDAA